MLKEKQIKESLYLDIETAGLYPTFHELVDANERLADIWRKRCVWLNKADGTSKSPEELWSEKSSLHPEFAKIVCVSMGYIKEDGGTNIKTLSGDEYDILVQLKDQLHKVDMIGWNIAGHTIKNFDIPFIGKRMVILGIDPPPVLHLFSKKPWETSLLDISEIFSFGSYGQAHTSLDLMTCVLGVDSSKDDIEGKDVHRVYWEGNIERIITYCEKDVEAVISCFKKM